ncbi:PAAR domain-containing protein [Enterobacter hormaechei]|uniref:PAAR domain-containing protein n=1 Tax=Enterobacter hormaechei TaxID=158836 RepID=UPI001F57814D|nr:PAAR domain-containing protein [Enterobacter hormaechei]
MRDLILQLSKSSIYSTKPSASSSITVDGKKVALVGDLVSCPIIGHGTNPIMEGSPRRTFNGRAVVVDGCKCQCGCKVISSAQNSTVG